MAEAGEFNLIIEKVTSLEAGAFLAEAFGLDPALTQAMLKTTPIIFATKLTKSEVKALSPRLQELSKQGFEFRITARTAKLPKVNWLVRPNFALPSTGSSGPVAFDFQNTAFVCPSCGDTFVFARVGKIPLSDANPGTPPLPATPTPLPSKSATGSIPVAKPAEPPKVKVSIPPKLELEDGAGANPTYAKKSGDAFADAELVEPLTDEALEGGDVAIDEDAPQIDLSSIEGPAEGESNPAIKTSVNLSSALDDTLNEQASKETAAAQAQAIANGELYNVFVPEVKDKARLEEVVKLVMQVRGLSEEEARKLTKRLMIPVAKGVSKDEAERILAQFKKIKTTGRMTKVNPATPVE